MTAIHVEVTAEDCLAAGAWPRMGDVLPRGWQNPVELAIGRLAGVDVDVDGDEDSWHATIGTTEGSTLVVDLPELARERLEFYYGQVGVLLEAFHFEIEIDPWLVALIAGDPDPLESNLG